MSLRLAAAVGLVLAAAGFASAQPADTYSKAVPPGKAALERLNLRTEWTAVVPVEGTRDTLTQVQTIDDQVFVQTRAGLFVAIDALTGRVQWSARLGNGTPGTSYPVAANSQFVFVAHITKLYAFYRYTGAVEFVAELGTPPTVGLAADETSVFCVLGMRPGSAGAHRVAVYDMPRAIGVNEAGRGPAEALAPGTRKAATSPVDDLLKRYAAGVPQPAADAFEPAVRPRVLEVPIGGVTGTRTPSLSPLPSVTPPYSLENRGPTPSLSTLPTMHPPYKLRQDSGKYIQQTPSLSTIPPSIAASLLLTDLRPKGVEPRLRWEYGMASRVAYPVTLTPTRAWVATSDNVMLGLSKLTKVGRVVTEASERLVSPIAAAPVAAGTVHYLPLANGTLIAIDATSGNVSGGLAVKWRGDSGGLNNHSPFVTKSHVYAAGDDTGVVCFDRATGDLIWRSDKSADRVIGATEELLYVRDRQGRFLVYDAKRATDPAGRRSGPLGSADFSEFGIHVVNTASDRVYLAADNGLIVCLRDAAAKYAKPVRIWPAPEVNPLKKISVEPPKDGTPSDPKKDAEPKKEPDPKTP